MRLEVERHRAYERRSLPQRDVLRLPSGALGGAAGFMESFEKLVAQERMLPGKRIPRRRLDARERVEQLDLGRVFLQLVRTAMALARL